MRSGMNRQTIPERGTRARGATTNHAGKVSVHNKRRIFRANMPLESNLRTTIMITETYPVKQFEDRRLLCVQFRTLLYHYRTVRGWLFCPQSAKYL